MSAKISSIKVGLLFLCSDSGSSNRAPRKRPKQMLDTPTSASARTHARQGRTTHSLVRANTAAGASRSDVLADIRQYTPRYCCNTARLVSNRYYAKFARLGNQTYFSHIDREYSCKHCPSLYQLCIDEVRKKHPQRKKTTKKNARINPTRF